ncbi:RNA-directed DNA polymerase, eukaryota, Reverse transcriptase zinc-binding domain protein [Artemisia annua]|uniref:RNA-directed DNA polymerase, eukaryota, Reverse transcriptase zinc-binding domain protein n=1 Tax=Artemisia annua TaxID=35608 RepID=A0A2U1QAJ0_ARTAN|nr:RNA-directed DNA polymerase, eukaryota, Reverse transcriptase zinc-binding domain protein [Artemisia annua]
MTWVRWNKCLASKDHGGLGIGSILVLNIGLLFKLIWSFSTWGAILSSINRFKQKGINLLSYCTPKVGDGSSTRFWEDVWCGDQALKALFPRIYLLDTDKICLVQNRFPFQALSSALRRRPRGGTGMVQFTDLQAKGENIVLSDQGDTWHWALNSSSFSVASVRSLIDSTTLNVSPIGTRWIRSIPIKVNIFLWRLMLNKLPSRVNLDRREYLNCPRLG